MANHHSHAALPYPIKGARFSLLVPYLDADGDPTDPTTPDTEITVDGKQSDGSTAGFSDCVEEVAAIAGSNGLGLLTLTGAETNGSTVGLAAKVASGPKATLATLYPRVLAEIGTGTLSAGSASGGTLGTVLPYALEGCFIKTTGGTGGGGTGGANNQARKIATYNSSTGAFTVAPDFETAVSNDTTYSLLLPEGVPMAAVIALPDAAPGAVGSISDVSHINGVAASSVTTIKPVIGLTTADTISALGNNTITAASIASDAITAAKIATDAITSSQLAASAVSEIQSGLALSSSLPANFSSLGINASGHISRVTLTDTLTTYTGNTPQTGDSYARLGAPVGASISADIAGVQSDTDNIQTRLPAALVSGRMDASVGAMATDVLTSAALAASAVSEIQSGLSTLDAAGVRSAVGLASANLDTQLGTLATAASIAALNNISTAQVLAQVETALASTTRSMPGQATPSTTPALADAIMQLFQQATNPSDQNSTKYQLYDRTGATVQQKRTVADDGSLFQLGALVTGP